MANISKIKTPDGKTYDIKGVVDAAITSGGTNPVTSAAIYDSQTAQDAHIARLVDGGAKNQCPVNEASAVKWIRVERTFPKGSYVLTCDINSTDTDAATCQCVFSNAGTILSVSQLGRGSGAYAAINLASEATNMTIYASNSAANSEGDTVAVSDLLLCTAEDYEASPEFVPYCPTMQELYRRILALENNS